jgi:hypothetical protein
MTKTRRILAAAAGIAVVIAVTAASSRRIAAHENPAEIARLRAHFDSVLRELRAADVTHLSASQTTARATLIARLEEYSAAGRFPHNHVRPGELVPVFRDEHRTLCAMGFLIASTGRADIVEHVTGTNNLVYIRELAGNAALRRWLDSTGLTLAEAGRIQPQYEGGPCFCVPEPKLVEADVARTNYAIVSAGGTAVSGAAMFLNLANVASRHKLGTWLGFAAGGAQMVYGGYAVQKHDSRSGMGVANIAIGGASAAIAAWRMRNPRPAKPSGSSGSAVGVTPYASPAGGVGLAFSARM